MIEATRKWFRRNRYPIAIGASLVGAGYLAGQYVIGKFAEARQRISDDRTAKEDLRRRFTQNQEDCTYTVLGLLPTVTENVLRQIPVEEITNELQARRSDKQSRGGPSASSSEIAPSDVHDEGSASASAEGSGSFVHASQTDCLNANAAFDGRARHSGKSKLQLWEDLKMLSITRAITMIYILSLLSLLTRIQLNLLGRRNYLSSVMSLAAAPPAGSSQISLEDRDERYEADYDHDFDTNRKYLTFSWWLLHRGWRQIMDEVEQAVKATFESVTPRDAVSFSRLSELIILMRKAIEGSTDDERRSKGWLKVMLPAPEEEQLVLSESGVVPRNQDDTNNPEIPPSLRRLLDETSDIIDSPTFSHVLTTMLDASFSLLIDEKIATLAYKIAPQHRPWSINATPGSNLLASHPLLEFEPHIQELPDETTGSTLATSTSCKLATILATFTKQAHAIGAGGDLTELVASTSVPEMTELPSDSAAMPSIKTANEYLASLEAVKDLEAFAAVIYSSNFELENVESPGMEEKAFSIHEEKAESTQKPNVSTPQSHGESALESAWSRATGSGG